MGNSDACQGASFFKEFKEFKEFNEALKELKIKN